MAVKIAGRKVKVGDKLYHSKMGWGRVSHFDSSGPAVLLIHVRPYGDRKVYVRNGGLVGEDRMIYWHEPLTLDYPSEDISMVQDIVDVVAPKLLPPRQEDDSE